MTNFNWLLSSVWTGCKWKNSWLSSVSAVPVSQILSSETGKNTLHIFIKWKQLQWQLIFGNFSPYLLVGTRSSLNHILKLINKPNKHHHSKYKCQFHQLEQISLLHCISRATSKAFYGRRWADLSIYLRSSQASSSPSTTVKYFLFFCKDR